MLKWSLAQLFKYNHKAFDFEDTFDYHEYIKNVDDILDISEVKVSGTGKGVFENRYSFDLHIECLLILECARTLEPVEFPIKMDITEVFDTDVKEDNEDDIRVIEKNTIDLYDIVWENIYLEKPMRVFKEGTTEYIDDQNLDDFYDEDK